ncbi:ATP-dependent DNA helicase [Trichonephila inaurata madagascariensis]|uniref:ATP-dependent DNA helicase n=1 Tax=Trichonephila inaurata madagascariensis TaxID=2747483 RepID=A0A8X7C6W6_9ARAC|nr:ATP-dependent DNA helicase [Trichonephila inaurata madagascariensis]
MVAMIIVGIQFQPKDIVLHRRNERLTKVAETHRFGDALKDPFVLEDGADEYNFNVKMFKFNQWEETSSKCNAKNYYTYLLMVRENENNHILKCRQLFHEYIVDMYAKIGTERLIFIRL